MRDRPGNRNPPEDAFFLTVARSLSKARDDYDRVLDASLAQKGGSLRSPTERILFYREEALSDLLSTLPSKTLVEATLQVCWALRDVNFIESNNFPFDDPDKDKVCRKVLRLLSSAIRVLIRETGVDLKEFGIDPDEWAEEIPA